MRSSRLVYYIHDSVAACRLELLGELADEDLPELDGCWKTARTTLDGRPIVVDTSALVSISDAGRQWLAAMVVEGATLVEAKTERREGSPAGWWRRVLPTQAQ